MYKVCLAGVGGISGTHIPAWKDMSDCQLVGICDIRPAQMEKYPELHRYTDIDEMLAAEQPDILDICLPTYLHADVAAKAMEKGIHVVTEKPISLKREDVDRLYGIAARNNVRFMVAQVLRFWPEYEYIKELYESGKYGRLLSGCMQRLNQCPRTSWDEWMKDEERSGLVPFDLHIHDLDFMVYAFGLPTDVITRRSKLPNQDVFMGMYTFDGFTIISEATWYAADYPFHASFRFQFEKAVVELTDALRVYEKEGYVTVSRDAATANEEAAYLPVSNAYYNELRYFVDCVKAGVDADKVKAVELKKVIDILQEKA